MSSYLFTRRQVGRALAATAVSANIGALPSAAQAQRADTIVVEARRITSFSRLFSQSPGRLAFRGGLVLTSGHRDFGGLSGIAVEQDGRRFLAVTDAGHWVSGTIAYEKSAPVGIEAARLGPLLGQSGREVTRRRDRDAEAIALIEGNLTRGTALIAFERNHRIGRVPITGGVLGSPSNYLKMPTEAKLMRGNQGIEAVTMVAGGPLRGSIIALCERFPGDEATHVGWIWAADGEPQRFTLPDIDGFELTDIASLVDGTLLVLERRFRWFEGVKMRLRLFKPGEIAPGKAAPRGEVLLQADMSSEIDNMEGLAVHRSPAGETVLTLVSDDNFNAVLQRTILLQFTLNAA